MRTSYDALVVGAGIGGIRSALDLAVAGQKVALVDKRPSIGGILTQLDYQFPTDHCGMCKMLPLTERDSSSQFCMRKGLFHKNIDIYLSSELVGLEGDPGSFRAELKQHSSFVDPTKCIGCGLCAEVCPVELPSEFNAGLTTRSAIYLPVPHAIPNSFTVDLDNCQRCWKCFEECPNDAIDFMFDERLDFHILVADPSPATFEDFSEWLKRQNFPLHSTTTGNETIDRLAGSQDDRLLFLDLDLADPGADRVLLRSLELRPDLTVILLARPEQREQAEELLQQGAREVLYKPVDAKSFVPWLDKLYMRLVSDKTLEFDIGAVILAAGFECYDPSEMQDVLGYGVHPAVVTSLEFERMCSSSGPSRAKLERSDGTPVKKIAWLQCVGSRDLKKNADFCSSFCCMISIKEALLAQKITKGEAETTIFYMDMRTFGRDFQRYRDQAESSGGVRFVNSRIHSATPGENPAQVCIEYLDHENQRVQEEFDMLVLGVGARPPKSMQQLAQ
ncbi:MAG: 4Fe-4S binding protein, partial [Desulfovibrionales bacterium]